MMSPLFLLKLATAEPVEFDISSGIRMGYMYMPKSTLQSSHSMMLGYEQLHRVETGTTIDFLILANLTFQGMNQGVVHPSGHLLLGYQIRESFYFGVGPMVGFTRLEPEIDAKLNMIVGTGWMIPMDGFSIPIQFGYVPDIDGEWKAHLSTGMSWNF